MSNYGPERDEHGYPLPPTTMARVAAMLEDGAPLEDDSRPCYPFLYGKAQVALMQANEEILRLRRRLAEMTAIVEAHDARR